MACIDAFLHVSAPLRLFEDAANKLNMKALVSFLQELCASSQSQLAQYGRPQHAEAGGTTTSQPVTALHLYRLGDIMMRCLHSGRPLLHTMRVWSVVAPHFVEVLKHSSPHTPLMLCMKFLLANFLDQTG